MEAKVDVRKLQILNDRINQTIDALNQVRLSVHGLGHTGGLQSQFNPLSFMAQGYGMQQPYGIGAQGGFPGVLGQFGGGHQQGPFSQGIPGLTSGFGFQHSPYNPYVNPIANPLLMSPWGVTGTPWNVAGTPWNVLGGIGGLGGLGGGVGGGIGTGLFHSGPDLIERQLMEARANDPFRITQTFPFVIS